MSHHAYTAARCSRSVGTAAASRRRPRCRPRRRVPTAGGRARTAADGAPAPARDRPTRRSTPRSRWERNNGVVLGMSDIGASISRVAPARRRVELLKPVGRVHSGSTVKGCRSDALRPAVCTTCLPVELPLIILVAASPDRPRGNSRSSGGPRCGALRGFARRPPHGRPAPGR